MGKVVEVLLRGMHQMYHMHDSWMMDQWMDGAALDRRMAVDWSEWPRTRSVVAPRDTSIDHSGGTLWPASQMVEARFVYRSVCGMDVRVRGNAGVTDDYACIGTEYLAADYMYATRPFLINNNFKRRWSRSVLKIALFPHSRSLRAREREIQHLGFSKLLMEDIPSKFELFSIRKQGRIFIL